MATIHFLNVLEGDCSIIRHDNGHVSVIDVSNAYDGEDTPEEKKAKEVKEREIKTRHFVPNGKIDYKMKEYPDNPVEYLNKLGVNEIFRFIITHPDMDHLDGIHDLFSSIEVLNTWDTDNYEEKPKEGFKNGYNYEDWEFYKKIRAGKVDATRLTLTSGAQGDFYTVDGIQVLAPSPGLVKQANKDQNIHDLSYVLLFTFPKKDGQTWKVIFGGDSHDNSWNYILDNHRELVTDIDVLIAPHHGRGSSRDFTFLETLNPRLTLFGNASATHLAYAEYAGERNTRITNNQAGYVVLNINTERILVAVRNKEFAVNFKAKRKWPSPEFDTDLDAYILGVLE